MSAARVLLLSLLLGTSMLARADSTAPAIAHMLDYISVDYPAVVQGSKVLHPGEYTEQQEFAARVIADLRRLADRPERGALFSEALQLKARIDARAPGHEVSKLATDLRWRVIGAYNVQVVPRRIPDIARAAALFSAQCAACHGVSGRGDGPAAPSLHPAPANFHDPSRMAQRSLYGLYSTITLGVSGTSMKGFGELSEDERWALAFYVGSLAADPSTLASGAKLWEAGRGKREFGSLRTLATLSESDVRARYGDDLGAVFASLKADPSRVQAHSGSPIEYARRLLAESLGAYRAGNHEEAQRLALGAYLEGFELAEPALNAVDGDLRQKIESEMIAYRDLLRKVAPAPDVIGSVDRQYALLQVAAQKLEVESLSPSAAGISAYLILLREGIEALLLVAALAAFVVKAGRREALVWIHTGWIGALVLGLLTWFLAARVIAVSGATRELTEGVTALLAAAILLYVGFWLHDKSHAQAWRRFIEDRLKGVLQARTLWALTGLSFLTVYREAFETVLFYQALWQQAGADAHVSVFTGFAAGAASLALIAWSIVRYGVRLPIGPFFLVCSVLMAALAIIFSGHGIKALQAAGILPASAISGITVRMLGIYPTMETVLAQLIAAGIVIGLFAWTRNRGSVTSSDLSDNQGTPTR